ncbi:adenylate kinase [Candidatus Woesebacteria bacterium]|nr:adenylate kinase [Candidatus Woesebacteria bacterium]|tara:strand:+ start:194 stop:736 length:543 start_codon:yes stop_codon:yes gene_type:complete
MNVVVLGPQGSGKSTQTKLLANALKFPMFDMGDILRSQAKDNSPLSEKIRHIIKVGQLLDDDSTMAVFREEIAKSKYKDGMVLDGAPRTLAQAELITKELKIDKVFYLRVSDPVNVERLIKRGRADDTPELIEKRLKLYHQKTEPVLAYYRKQGILEEIDGEQEIERIALDIKGRVMQND